MLDVFANNVTICRLNPEKRDNNGKIVYKFSNFKYLRKKIDPHSKNQ